MLRICLAGALSALMLSLAPVSAQSSDGSVGNCISGNARGAWNLPVQEELGQVRGMLFDSNGHRLVLEARLIPASKEAGFRGGKFEGVLTPQSRDGSAQRPVATVSGEYMVDDMGRGRFRSVIARITTTPELHIMGRFEGVFRDPNLGDRDSIGKFVGRWTVCR